MINTVNCTGCGQQKDVTECRYHVERRDGWSPCKMLICPNCVCWSDKGKYADDNHVPINSISKRPTQVYYEFEPFYAGPNDRFHWNMMFCVERKLWFPQLLKWSSKVAHWRNEPPVEGTIPLVCTIFKTNIVKAVYVQGEWQQRSGKFSYDARPIYKRKVKLS